MLLSEKSCEPEPLPLPACTHDIPHAWTRFDVLLGADGPASRVRGALRIGSSAQSDFTHEVRRPGLGATAGGQLHFALPQPVSQVTLIAALEVDASGVCPQPRRDPSSGAEVAPYLVGFDEPGVTFCFKRL